MTTLGKPESPRAAFFDRDGVLNVDTGYVRSAADFVWRPTAIESVKWLNGQGVLAFVVTNQSGVARGLYSEADVIALHDYMQAALALDGAHIDAFRYCPHHPEAVVERYRQSCACRKPRSGMIEDLLQAYGLNPAQCRLFGDRATDLAAGRGVGVTSLLVTDERPLLEIVREAFSG